jgi:hypothetical protein
MSIFAIDRPVKKIIKFSHERVWAPDPRASIYGRVVCIIIVGHCDAMQIKAHNSRPKPLALGLTLVAVVTFCSCGRERGEFTNGHGQAERDLAAGRLTVAFTDGANPDGTNVPAFWEYTDLLRKRYNIGWVVYSLPADPKAATAWVRGYNEVAIPRIEHEIAAHVLAQAMKDAQELHAAAAKTR